MYFIWRIQYFTDDAYDNIVSYSKKSQLTPAYTCHFIDRLNEINEIVNSELHIIKDVLWKCKYILNYNSATQYENWHNDIAGG